MDEATIQALLHVCEGDQVSDDKLVWRTPSVQQSTAMFAHHEGSDFLSITSFDGISQRFESYLLPVSCSESSNV